MKASRVVWSVYLCAVIVSAFILGLLTFVVVVALPSKSGVSDYITNMMHETPSLAFVALILFILFLVAPFYASRWMYSGVLKLGLLLKRQIENRK